MITTDTGKTPTFQMVESNPQTDPAFAAAPLLLPIVTTLLAYLSTGPENGVDWAKFKDDAANGSDGAPSTKSLNWLLANLKTQQTNATLGQEQPSRDLRAAFDECINVGLDFQGVVEILADFINLDGRRNQKTSCHHQQAGRGDHQGMARSLHQGSRDGGQARDKGEIASWLFAEPASDEEDRCAKG